MGRTSCCAGPWVPLPRRWKRGRGRRTPRPLAIPDVPQWEPLRGGRRIMGAAAQWVRSVHLHLLVFLPAPGIRRGGRARWRCEIDRRRPRWMPGSRRRNVVGWVPGPARFERAAALARDMRNSPGPRGGEPVAVSSGGWRGGCSPVPHLLLDTRRRHWQCRCQRRRQYAPDRPREARVPGAPHNLARLRHDRERRGRGRGSYPTGRRWGADPGELGGRHSIATTGRESGGQGACGLPGPYDGEASRRACQ